MASRSSVLITERMSKYTCSARQVEPTCISCIGRVLVAYELVARQKRTPSRDVLTLFVCPDAVHLYPPAWRRRFIMFISID